MFSYVQIGQKKHIDDLTEDIETQIAAIESVPDVNKILTIQNQLDELPALHEGKPETSRLFTILTQVTPADIKIRSVEFDLLETTMTISGSANDLASINRYADTLKFARYNTADEKDLTPFTSVITTLNRNEESASYELAVEFDPQLFDNTKEITMVVPEKITTRSTLGKPNLSDQGDNALFDDNQGEGN